MNSIASLRHHDENVVALFDEQTGKLGGFIGGDGASDTEHDRISRFAPLERIGFSIGRHWSRLGKAKTPAQDSVPRP